MFIYLLGPYFLLLSSFLFICLLDVSLLTCFSIILGVCGRVSDLSCRPVLAPTPAIAPTHIVYLLVFFFGQFSLLGCWLVSWPCACFLKCTASPLAKIFAASYFWNAMCTAHAFVSRILDRLHLPQKTSGFPTSPPPAVACCVGGCNYIFLHSAAEPDVLSPISPFPRRWQKQRCRSQICLRPSLWWELRLLRLNCLAAPLGLEAAGWALRQSLLFEQRWIALKLTLGFCSWHPQTDSFITSQRMVQITWSRCSLAYLPGSVSIMWNHWLLNTTRSLRHVCLHAFVYPVICCFLWLDIRCHDHYSFA